MGILGTSPGTEPIARNYLRGQVFNREVPEKENLHYRLFTPPYPSYYRLFVTNNQISSTSDVNDIALNSDFHLAYSFIGGWLYGLGAPQLQAIYYQLPEFSDSKKAIKEVFSIYGYKYLVYVCSLRIQTEPRNYLPIPLLPTGSEDFNPKLELNIDFYNRLKSNKFKFKRPASQMSGYSLEGWKLFVYPPNSPVSANNWYHYFNAEIATELDCQNGYFRQIPRGY